MSISLTDFVESAEAASSPDALNEAFLDYIGQYGFEAVSYHLLKSGFDTLSFEASLNLCTFPEAWVEHYQNQSYFDDDPIMQRAMTATLPFHWFDVERDAALNPTQKQFFNDLHAAGFTDGLGIPVFGPYASAGFFGMGIREGRLDLSMAQIRELQFACHHVHNRSFEIRGTTVLPALSSRESEVLHWAAQGKSNGVIADILGVSTHTVDTVMRRVFVKLGVNSRVSAVLKAVGNGLVTI